MRRETEKAMRALARTDETIHPKLVDPAMDILRGRTAAGAVLAGGKLDPILKRAQVAKILGVTPVTVDRYCRLGLLRRVKPTKRSARAIGISSESVREFEGKELLK